ncbi:diguanylate cyclase [Gilvimarinus xylanilyticus]|uniref:diguanylate cyclase n=1 Tax=Gilvimarinus xylanilyticus TaxID=2944139 RepID=A0A9X2HXP7_9GAMM|nr:sensor domain-containing diguanylate cyclase [Gilvimarinus xylanilyticus]
MTFALAALLLDAGYALSAPPLQHDASLPPARYLLADQRLSLEQAMASSNWLPLTAKRANQGLSRRDHWVHFTFDNSTDQPQTRFLVSQTSYLDTVNVFYQDANGTPQALHLSDRQPFSERPVEYRTLTAPLTFAPHTNTDVYLQAYNQKTDSVTLGFQLLTPQQFNAIQQRDYAAMGAFYGALGILIIISLVFAVMLRQINALYYALFLLSSAVMWLPLNGLGYQWLWPNAVYWHNEGIHLSYLGFVFFALQFSKSFLQLRRFSSALLRIFQILQFFALASIALRLAGFYEPVLYLSFILLILLALVIPLASALVWRQGLGYALWSLLAWLLYAAGLISSIISATTSWLPWGMTPLLLAQSASMLETIFLMIGMATWLVNLELERQKALALANEDPLTELGNRRLLQTAFEHYSNTFSRDTRPAFLIMIDLDYFKIINDTYGHDAGDQVLREVGQLLKRNCREEDVVTRFGGEEFAILLRAADQERALSIAERIRHEFSTNPTHYAGQDIAHTLCCGIAEVLNTQWQPSVQEMMRHADEALYQAKAAGRNQNHLYCP